MAVQFSNPDVSIDFDANQQQAIATRKELFKRINSKIFIAGMHLPFTGICKMQADGDSKYIGVPVGFFQSL